MVKRAVRGIVLLFCVLAALPVAASPDLFLETEVEPARVVVQTQAVYRLRFFQGVDVNGLKITGPSAALADFRQIGETRVSEAVRDGRRYRVHERTYAVFPFASGGLEIAGARAEGQVAASTGKFPDGRRVIRLEAPPRLLTVLPAPAAVGLPAKSLALSETSSMPAAGAMGVGEVLLRRIRIEAAGVDAGQLPEIRVEVPGMSVYAEPARLENQFRGEESIASREQVFRLVPLRPGTMTMPAVHLRWWKADAGEAAVAVLPARKVRVVAAGAAAGISNNMVAGDSPPYLALSIAGGLLVVGAAGGWRCRAAARAAWRLHRACRAGDVEAVRDGVLAWAAARWPGPPPLTLGALAEGLGEDPARRALAELDRSLYGPAAGGLAGKQLAAMMRRIKLGVRRQRTGRRA